MQEVADMKAVSFKLKTSFTEISCIFCTDLAWNDPNVPHLCLFECTLFLQEIIFEKTAELSAKQDQASVTGLALHGSRARTCQ